MTHSQDRKKLKAERKAQKQQKTRLVLNRTVQVISNTWLLLTVISATFCVYLVFVGTEGDPRPKFMAAPLAITTALTLVRQFNR